MSQIDVLPDELVAAAEPLRRAAESLGYVADSRRALVGLLEAAPSPRLVEAFRTFLSAWELVVWSGAQDASSLADEVTDASSYYADRERAIARRVPDVTPWGDMPPLRDPVAAPVIPHPQPGPAIVPAP